MTHHPIVAAFPFPIVLAEAVQTSMPVEFGWRELINYGALGVWVGFMIYRDYRESIKQDKRHDENLAASKKIEEAFRNQTNLVDSKSQHGTSTFNCKLALEKQGRHGMGKGMV